VRRVDDGAYVVLAKPGRETFRAAEAADAHFADRKPWAGDSPRERRDNAHFAFYEVFGELSRFARPTEDEDHAGRP